MRFSLLALVLPLASAFEVSRSSDYSPRNANTLVQRAVAAVDICAQVAINVPLSVRSCVVVSTGLSLDLSGLSLSALNTGISLGLYTCTTVSTNVLVGNNICACASGGVLDGDTIARLQALVTANGPAIQLLTTATNAVLNPYTTGTSGTLIGTIQNIVRGLLATEKTSCNLPTGAIAKCSSTPCSYDCPAGQSVCANQCAASCISGVPGRRSLNSEITDMRCPTGLSACALPSSVLGGRYGFECVDTRSDLESCGACAFPLPGRPLGRDCSLIPNAADVACANGSCVVQSCVSGWELNDDATSCVSVISGEQSVVEEILGDAIWVQQKLSGATIQARKAALRKRQANAAKLRASKRRL